MTFLRVCGLCSVEPTVLQAETKSDAKPAKGVGRGNAPGSKVGHANLKQRQERKKRRTHADLLKVILRPGDPGRAAKVLRAKKGIKRLQQRLKSYCVSNFIQYHEDDQLFTTAHGEFSGSRLLEDVWYDPATQKVKKRKMLGLHQLDAPDQGGKQKARKKKGPKLEDLRTLAREAWDEMVELKIVSPVRGGLPEQVLSFSGY